MNQYEKERYLKKPIRVGMGVGAGFGAAQGITASKIFLKSAFHPAGLPTTVANTVKYGAVGTGIGALVAWRRWKKLQREQGGR